MNPESLKKQVDRVKVNLKKQADALMKKADKQIEKDAAYLARSLHNAPRRAKRMNPEKPRKSTHYVESSTPNRIFFPNPNGGEPVDSGMTVEQYLRHIKGGFRAKGAGSFTAHKFKFHEKKEYLSPDFERQIGVVYKIGPGSSRVSARQKETHTKGTGKFSDKERERIDRVKRRRLKLEKRLKTAEKKEVSKLKRQIALLEKQARYKRKLTVKKRRRAGKRADEKRLQLLEKREDMRLKREKRLQEHREKNRLYRIVRPSGVQGRRHTAYPQKAALLRMSTPSGQPPKTWYGEDGHRNKFLATHWNVKKIKDLHWEVFIEPKPRWPNSDRQDKQFLQRIEYGGSFVTKPLVKGYLVNFQDEAQGIRGRKQRFSHRRISFAIIKGKSKYVSVRPHPFVDATVKRVRKTIRERRDKNQLKIPFGK